MILAVAAIGAAIEGIADAGVEAELPGGSVLSVSRTGFGWRDGIRAGQTVTRLVGSDEPGGWLIETRSSDRSTLIARSGPVDEALRNALPLGLVAFALAAFAIVAIRAWTGAAILAATLALHVAAPPLITQGEPVLSTIALAATVIVPGGILISRAPSGRLATMSVAGLIAFLVAWAIDRLGAGTSDVLEPARNTLALVIAAVTVLWLVVFPAVQRGIRWPTPSETLEVGSIAAITAVAVSMIAVGHVPPVVVGCLVLASVALFPRWRHLMTAGADRVVFADVRERAAIEAQEAERARVARDLHDAPLQHLAGVIRRLEVASVDEGLGDALRIVADDLRSVATDLRPPALDDYGLVAALEFMAAQERGWALVVVVHLDQEGDGRPPAAVELAVYRIVEQAIENAALHARAISAQIRGCVSSTHVRIEVRDDGTGFIESSVDTARRRGRLGLATMRRRADLIGADLRLTSNHGAIVELEWRP